MPGLYNYYTKAGSLFHGHLNIMERAFFCTQAPTFTKVIVKFVSAGGGRYFDRTVWAIHVSVAELLSIAAFKDGKFD